jgi:hypothetical protein
VTTNIHVYFVIGGNVGTFEIGIVNGRHVDVTGRDCAVGLSGCVLFTFGATNRGIS